MLRKAFITGILMFFNKGSLVQVIVAMVFCLAFLCAVAWLRPFASRTANLFKVGAEAALLVTLMLIVLLKVDLSKEDVPGGNEFIGFLLLLSNTALPGGALTLAILSFGFDTGQAAYEADQEQGEKEQEREQEKEKEKDKKKEKDNKKKKKEKQGKGKEKVRQQGKDKRGKGLGELHKNPLHFASVDSVDSTQAELRLMSSDSVDSTTSVPTGALAAEPEYSGSVSVVPTRSVTEHE
jgi:hypothetical protein